MSRRRGHRGGGKSRVAIFDCYVAATPYGNHRYIEAVFRHLRSDGYELVFVSPYRPEDADVMDSVVHNIISVPAPSQLMRFAGRTMSDGLAGQLRTILSLVAYNIRLAHIFRRERVRVVQCSSLRNLLTCGVAAKLAGARILWYVNGHLDNPWLDPIGFVLADRVLFQNSTNMWRRYRWLVNRRLSRIRIIENGIDLNELDNATSSDKQADILRSTPALRPRRGVTRVGYVGQLSPLKGVADLLEATCNQRVRGTVELFVIGDPGVEELKPYAESLWAQYRSSPRVHFLGYRRDALTLLSLMDIFVLPSLSEGVPRSILEAMACGVPVIATRVGGVPGIIQDSDNGILVSPGRPADLAAAIERLAGDPALRAALSTAAFERVRRRWDIRLNVSNLRLLHEELAA